MRQVTELSLKRAELQSAKRALDEATQRFQNAAYELSSALKNEANGQLSALEAPKRVRQPKGRTRDLVLLAFSTGSLGRAGFKEVHAAVGSLAGENISEATVRQTLYRMEKTGELERYSGQWSRGFTR